MQKIVSFTDLATWQEGHKLVLAVYKATQAFPKSEAFNLISQIQRAVVSITSNVAEGFSRKSKKEKVQFYYTAVGSLTELQNQLIIARDLSYVDKDTFQALAKQSVTVHKLLCGIIKSAENRDS